VIRILLLALVAGVLGYLAVRWRREKREDALARARAAFLVRTAAPASPGREAPALDEVTLAGGRLLIRVPRAWGRQMREGQTAFEARASSGRRLRVDVETKPGDGPVTAEEIARTLRESAPGREGAIEVLDGDRVLLKHVQRDDGPDGPHLLYRWELRSPASGAGTVVASIALRVPGEATDAITEDDLRLLEREVRAAHLGTG
jgi:hypothetical protein